jgi:genome maintenance exonuclease 1
MKSFRHEFITFDGSISSIEDDRGRRYQTPDGVFPSVTTVTGWKKRAFFAHWRKKNPDESRRVLSRGTAMHSTIESYLLNILTPQLLAESEGTSATDLFHSMREDIDRIGAIRAIEVALWSKKIGLAGRTDCIGEFDGKLSVIDFKSSTNPKSEDGILDYFTQATAYALMWQDRTGQPIPNITIIIGVESGGCQVFESTPREHVENLFDYISAWKRDQWNTK